LFVLGCALLACFAFTASAARAATTTVLGPVYPLPGYNDSAHQTHGGSTCVETGSIAAGNLNWSFGGSASTTAPTSVPTTCNDTVTPPLPPFDTTRFQTLYWGLNLTQANQVTITCNAGCTTAPTNSGPMTYDATDSHPAQGVVVYQGSTDPQDHLTLTFRDGNRSLISLTDATTIGSFQNTDLNAANLGFVVAATSAVTNFSVGAAYTVHGTPLQNAVNLGCHCQSQTDITGGFYYVDRPPAGDFTFSAPSNHQPVTLTAGTPSDPDGTVASWSWDLNGDGTYGDNPNASSPQTPALGPGTYTVGLQIVDNEGTVTNTTHQFTIANQPPTGSISIVSPGTDPPGNHQPATFHATVSDPDQGGGVAPTYSWDLAGGTTYGQNPNADATASFGPGTHTVAVLVTDSDGASTRIEKTFTIANAPPVASFACTPTTILAGQPVTCTASDSDPDAAPGDPALQEEWSFNGATASGHAATFVLPAGSYPVSLLVTDGDGGTATVSHTLVVQKPSGGGANLIASASLVPKQKLRAALTNGIKGTFNANEASSSRLVLTLSTAQARKLHLTGNLWTGAPRLRAPGSTGFSMTLSKAAARKLLAAKHANFLLAGTATDSAGNHVSIRLSFALS
jgi:hypothetical protein